MARRISITIPDDVERAVLARLETQPSAKEGAFNEALVAYVRELEIRIQGYERTIAILERVAASGSAPASPAPKAAEDWGDKQW